MFSQDKGYLFTQPAYQVKVNVVPHQQTETVNKGFYEADWLIDPDHHAARECDEKWMLSVPCFTVCHYFEGKSDQILGRRVKKKDLKDGMEGKLIYVLQII